MVYGQLAAAAKALKQGTTCIAGWIQVTDGPKRFGFLEFRDGLGFEIKSGLDLFLLNGIHCWSSFWSFFWAWKFGQK